MGDLLAQGSAWLEQQRTLHLTRDVTYVRGAESVVVKATVGRTEYQTDDGQVVRTDYTDRDYLILATDLVLAGDRTLPATGDQVRETQDGTVYVHEVMGWRYSDPYRKTFRIETKLVQRETL